VTLYGLAIWAIVGDLPRHNHLTEVLLPTPTMEIACVAANPVGGKAVDFCVVLIDLMLFFQITLQQNSFVINSSPLSWN
jgi:hypothetical protein